MSNGEVCCILGVCCPPAARKQKVASALALDLSLSETDALAIFEWFDSRVDFGPKGTIQPAIDAVAALARQHPPHDDV